MPSYDYECDSCGFKFRVSHSITTKMTDCIECEREGSLNRYTPSSNFISFVEKTENKKVGTIVKESIADFRQELEQQKRDIKNRSFDG